MEQVGGQEREVGVDRPAARWRGAGPTQRRVVGAVAVAASALLMASLLPVTARSERVPPSARAPEPAEAASARPATSAVPAAPATARAADHVLTLRRGGTERIAVSVYLDAARGRGFFTHGEGPNSRTSPIYPMWKAAAADLDGDGRDRIVVGMWSWQRRHDEPSPHRAVWVLAYDGRALYEEWRGSALARPLRDFSIVDLDGDGADELVALEASPRGCVATAYRWNGFGFAGIDSIPVDCAARLGDRAGCLANDGRPCFTLDERTLELR